MLAWYRAAAMAVGVHLLVFFLFIFTWKGMAKDYQVEFLALGSILSAYEVSSLQNDTMADAQDQEIQVMGGRTVYDKIWTPGMRVDKPDNARSAGALSDDRLIRFLGEPVHLDEESGIDRGDIPSSSLMDIRLERP